MTRSPLPLLMLQTRSVVTTGFLSEHFDVTERTIYRDIRTLENAGALIGSEAGVGYFLEKGYRLPLVSFTLDEAASLGFDIDSNGVDKITIRGGAGVGVKNPWMLLQSMDDMVTMLQENLDFFLGNLVDPPSVSQQN